MATKTEAKDSKQTVTHSGVVLDGKVVVGNDHGLTDKQQGQKAKGELDDNLRPIVKEEKTSGSTAGSAAANAALTDKEKAEDIQIKERRAKTLKEDGTVSGLKPPPKVNETLYQGWISAEGVSAQTGEAISYKMYVAEPTTEEGLRDAFMQALGSAKRDSLKFDPENKIDPTKRTYLERP